MFISHKYKIIFIKTTKTGGSSFEFAFRKFLNAEDIIAYMGHDEEVLSAGLVQKANDYVPFKFYTVVDWYNLISRNRRKRYREHMTAQEIKDSISPEVWKSYFKFCVERNPMEKVRSRYYWTGIKTGLSLDEYAIKQSHLDSDFYRYSTRGNIIVDKVFKYEEMEEWLPEFERKIGLSGSVDMKNVKLKSGFRPKQKKTETFSEHAKEAIRRSFAKEIMHFYPELK